MHRGKNIHSLNFWNDAIDLTLIYVDAWLNMLAVLTFKIGKLVKSIHDFSYKNQPKLWQLSLFLGIKYNLRRNVDNNLRLHIG